MESRPRQHRRPRLVLITTGGTIGTARNYATRISGEELLALVPGWAGVAEVEVDQADARPSPMVTPGEMLALAARAQGHLDRPEIGGVVLTFGTDAMDEFIYLLYLTVVSPKPTVVTGAMMHSREPFADGPRNLLHALMVAGSPASRDRGVMLVMQDLIHSARDAVKINSVSLSAFASPKYGPLGAIEGRRVTFRRIEPPRTPIRTEVIEPSVDLIAASVGMDGRFVDASVAAGSRGLVVAAMGGGAVPQAMGQRLSDLGRSRFPIVIASRCAHGSVMRGGMLEEHHLAAGDLPAHKARIRLMLALGATKHLPPEKAWDKLTSLFPG